MAGRLEDRRIILNPEFGLELLGANEEWEPWWRGFSSAGMALKHASHYGPTAHPYRVVQIIETRIVVPPP